MAWNSQKNDIFFRRVQNFGKTLISLLEERDRLTAIYTNEARPSGVDDAAFVDHAIATKQELIDFATNVMVPFDAFLNNAAVTTRNRIPDISPFMVEQ